MVAAVPTCMRGSWVLIFHPWFGGAWPRGPPLDPPLFAGYTLGFATHFWFDFRTSVCRVAGLMRCRSCRDTRVLTTRSTSACRWWSASRASRPSSIRNWPTTSERRSSTAPRRCAKSSTESSCDLFTVLPRHFPASVRSPSSCLPICSRSVSRVSHPCRMRLSLSTYHCYVMKGISLA